MKDEGRQSNPSEALVDAISDLRWKNYRPRELAAKVYQGYNLYLLSDPPYTSGDSDLIWAKTKQEAEDFLFDWLAQDDRQNEIQDWEIQEITIVDLIDLEDIQTTVELSLYVAERLGEELDHNSEGESFQESLQILEQDPDIHPVELAWLDDAIELWYKLEEEERFGIVRGKSMKTDWQKRLYGGWDM